MNFTREPIIETILSPKEGCKLLVRSSKGGKEEYTVDAVELVSFSGAIFFRSVDRSKSFLLPVTDYEVIEVKEARMVLKAASPEKSVKIAGGKEAAAKASKEPAAAENGETKAAPKEKKERRRTRRRRTTADKAEPKAEKKTPDAGTEGGDTEDETKVSSSTFTGLLRPPSQLIRETIIQEKSEELSQGDLFSKEVGDNESPTPKEEPSPLPPPPDVLTEEREKNQPIFPSFREEEHEVIPPPPVLTAPPKDES